MKALKMEHTNNIYINERIHAVEFSLEAYKILPSVRCVHCRLINEFAGNDFFELQNTKFQLNRFLCTKNQLKLPNHFGGKNYCFEIVFS